MEQMMSEKLQGQIRGYFGEKYLSDKEIPSHISENLSKNLREYQIECLKYYLANFEDSKFSKTHLMFNMATGSGKTLIMAALMLDCYKRGYRDFVFFVNATAILEKTKSNFCDSKSAKYLFKNELIIDEKRVQINEIANLNESNEGAINIYFSTIQGLYSLFKDERENSLTLEDLKDKKLVFLADEAHHLNSQTKKEKDDNEGWEGIMKKAFVSHSENLMFEFSATIPHEKSVLDKYKDKTIFEYALKQFYADKYSKKIYLVKYENDDYKHRFLGAIVMNVFRQFVGLSYKLKHFKPVILFKSERKNQSEENEEKFKAFIAEINSKILSDFAKNLNEESGFLRLAFEFFELYYKKSDFYDDLDSDIKNFFKDENAFVNMNKDTDEVKRQILINSLEDKDNPVRVIFAVDKLNEGWDVLNLFDIVRLGAAKTSKNISTKEAQLIGRGARYYPFKLRDDENEYKRKFDEINDEKYLQAIEALSYHTLNDLDFINELNKSLEGLGLAFENMRKKIILKPQQKAKDLGLKSIKVARNERRELPPLFNEDLKEFIMQSTQKEIPLLGNLAVKEREAYKKDDEIQEHPYKNQSLTKIQEEVFLKALNKAKLSFICLKMDFKDIESKRDFIKRYLYTIECKFHKKQAFNKEEQLLLAGYILGNLKEALQKQRVQKCYEVLEFKAEDFSVEQREIYSEKEPKNAGFEWLVYDMVLKLTSEEEGFLKFIEERKDDIDELFEKWLMIRNEQFSELKIYDNRKGKHTYSNGFEPDFIFWGKRKDKQEVIMQCFIEAKGEHLATNEGNKWKEEFLESLLGNVPCDNASINLRGLPFYKENNNERFKEAFKDFLEGENLA